MARKGLHKIGLDDAIAMTKRARKVGMLTVEGWHFHRDIIDQILAQPGVTGMRFYLGVDNKTNAPTLIMVGTMVKNVGTDEEKDWDMCEGVLGEFGDPCPPYCDPTSVLHVDVERK